MIRIQHDSKLDVVCVFWRDVERPFFHAKTRPVAAIPLYIGTVSLGGDENHPATRVAAVLATKQGEPDWCHGVGVVLRGTEVDSSVFDFMLKVLELARREGVLDANAASQARRDILDMAAIRN